MQISLNHTFLIQIFEIEDEFEEESALDTQDAGPVPPIDMIRQRRQSTMSKRHVSGSSSRSQSHGQLQAQPLARSTSSSPRKYEGEPSIPQPGPALNPLHPRQRLTSIVASGLDMVPQGIGSPLKQALAPFPSFVETHHQPNFPLAGEAGTSGESSNAPPPVS